MEAQKKCDWARAYSQWVVDLEIEPDLWLKAQALIVTRREAVGYGYTEHIL